MHRGAPCTAVHHHLCAPAPWCITVVGAPGCTLHRVHRMCEAPASRCFDVRLRQGAWCCTSCDPGAPHERDGDRMTIPKPRLLHHEQQAAQAQSERQRREREASASHVHRTPHERDGDGMTIPKPSRCNTSSRQRKHEASASGASVKQAPRTCSARARWRRDDDSEAELLRSTTGW